MSTASLDKPAEVIQSVVDQPTDEVELELGETAGEGDRGAEKSLSVASEQKASWRNCGGCLRTPRRRLCCAVSSCCAFMLAVVLAVCLPLFWPQDPTWQLTKLELADPMALQVLIGAFQGMSGDGNSTMPPLTFLAEVDLHNPNRIGADAGRGEFAVSFKGMKFGEGYCLPSHVPAGANVLIAANVSVQLYPEVAQELAAEVMANEFVITVHVSGHTIVQAPFGIQMFCSVECDIDSEVTQLLGPTPQNIMKEKRCKYEYKMSR
ncbi:unnamed protein product [Polarella glacialis]|uniref:Late embryogenesis abundant protein LEA-2 subgroup domain-containing protein n=1 Tax=Polarella glacialis TaxID=89957 RepID=A0A813IPY5_POLGL|nr:unnamed protein product [Polarella glacialis]CAE8653694.1 unnamed protein product [Polarella glacialis]